VYLYTIFRQNFRQSSNQKFNLYIPYLKYPYDIITNIQLKGRNMKHHMVNLGVNHPKTYEVRDLTKRIDKYNSRPGNLKQEREMQEFMNKSRIAEYMQTLQSYGGTFLQDKTAIAASVLILSGFALAGTMAYSAAEKNTVVMLLTKCLINIQLTLQIKCFLLFQQRKFTKRSNILQITKQED